MADWWVKGEEELSAGPRGLWVADVVPVLQSAWALHPRQLCDGAREPLGTEVWGRKRPTMIGVF